MLKRKGRESGMGPFHRWEGLVSSEDAVVTRERETAYRGAFDISVSVHRFPGDTYSSFDWSSEEIVPTEKRATQRSLLISS
jgi:hypothetical protein